MALGFNSGIDSNPPPWAAGGQKNKGSEIDWNYLKQTPAFPNAPTPPKIPTAGELGTLSGQNWITGQVDPGLQSLLRTGGGAPVGNLGQLNFQGAWDNPMVSAIGQAGQQQLSAGLDALQRMYSNQYQDERGRLASRGLVGSGPENEALRRLEQTQAAEAGTYAANIGADTLRAQSSAAMQALGLTNDRDIANLQARLDEKGLTLQGASQLAQMESERLISEGKLDQAAAFQDKANALSLLGLQQDQFGTEASIWGTNVGAIIDSRRNAIEATKAESEEDAMTRELYLKELSVAVGTGMDGEELSDYIEALDRKYGIVTDDETRRRISGLSQTPEGIPVGSRNPTGYDIG